MWTKIVCKLSAKDAHALLQRATLLKARVILVGDTRQLSAVSLD
ncbi:AAA family ATPase [Nostoc sp. C057]|nr:AAA family ATPase [Nostoc sp. C057]